MRQERGPIELLVRDETINHRVAGGTSSAGTTVQPEAIVTFHRDHNGRIYYIVTDGRVGDELQQIPMGPVCRVSEENGGRLKQEETTKETVHVEGKA